MSAIATVATIKTLDQLNHPKSTVGLIHLPCGYLAPDGSLHTETEVKEMSGDEEDLLSSKKVPNHKKWEMLLQRCVTRIGTYTSPMDIVRIIPKLMIGDRTSILFATRQVTVGDLYFFPGTCPTTDKDKCDDPERLYTADLRDLEVKRMEKPEQRVYDVKLPRSGLQVRFHVMTGEDEERVSELSKKEDAPTLMLLSRIDLIGDQPPRPVDIKGLPFFDRQWLRQCMEDVEGNLDVGLELECPGCKTKFEDEVDIAAMSFFFPSVALRNWKKKFSSSWKTGD